MSVFRCEICEKSVDSDRFACYGYRGGLICEDCLETGFERLNDDYGTVASQRLELLEALERTLSWLTSYPGEGALSPTGPYEQARAAIAKARGTAV